MKTSKKPNKVEVKKTLPMGMEETIAWYDSNALLYAENNNAVEPEYIDHFAKMLFKGAKVIDVGSGPGHKSWSLKEKGLNVIGVDLSKGLIEEAKRRYPSIDFIVGDMLNLPFQNEEFDGIWSNASIVHLNSFNDTKKAMSEMGRVAKKGAVLHLGVKAQVGGEKFANVSDKLSGHNRFFQYYTLEEIEELLKFGGFNDIKILRKEKDPYGRKDTVFVHALAKKSDI